MRIAVVGATGNTGTAVLRALHRHPEITEVVGIARRLPDTEIEPYDQCEWRSIDIAAASTEADAVQSLTDAFRGCDAVIHLAWLIQPNDRRELLERVNVEGTRNLLAAADRAGRSERAEARQDVPARPRRVEQPARRGSPRLPHHAERSNYRRQVDTPPRRVDPRSRCLGGCDQGACCIPSLDEVIRIVLSASRTPQDSQ